MSEAPETPAGGTRPLPVIEKDGPEFDQSASAASYTPVLTPADGGERRRLWSTRRIPATLLGLLVLGAAGLLLYDVAAVRADRPAMAWRRTLAEELAERRLDDVAVLAGAAAAAAIGLWLLILALTPGRRDVLPMASANPGVRSWLDRDAAALVLRDRAMQVSGVQSVRVKVKRRKVDVKAVSHFRELDDVRADLDTAVGAGLGRLGLAHGLNLAVSVTRPGRKG
ncbi:hypothetical protein DSC45_11645 [Streptomyces sp. YIM 130001]|uniref:DUF6286 domain-containing protein n=1 Tax=Streptomyces sp. YIM 130001 TaxID=2259644 RepID=UPI000E650FED|nr:DUF6286 domain-containing protein [Streptomyces sp. YIM 130001]RII18564.1 hypothetical protein DSC45_11645 [Streptomyces sp. YIM 130001]